jgi:(p)ppGpp synthase/HD superfamily hydrolase
MTLVTRARELATRKHAHLHRPNKAQQPIVVHLAEVAALAKQAGGTDAQIAAAWLHDIVEDTETTLEDIRAEFGDEVAALVDGLTDPADFEPMPLFERKALQAERLKGKPVSVWLVKLCDQISNVRSVVLDPPVSWDAAKSLAYVDGAKVIAEVCKGQSPLLDEMFAEAYREACKKYRN